MKSLGQEHRYNYVRQAEVLSSLFKMRDDTDIGGQTAIRTFPFQSEFDIVSTNSDCARSITSDNVNENFSFEYPVFINTAKEKQNQVILLLHGLNERSWDKYLTWADYLCKTTGKAVLLFPIAYHINRSPQSWSNPRIMQKIVEMRIQLLGRDRSLSIANAALSERLYHNPERFFRSGQQSCRDLIRLAGCIRSGQHPLFATDTDVDIFAYSIGALLSQVMLLSDKQGLFSNSKLFLFCGGSLFERMFGQSRSIMDRFSFERLLSFYKSESWSKKEMLDSDPAHLAFNTMLDNNTRKDERHEFFKKMNNRLAGVSLALDTVIPYRGIVEALGHESASKKIKIFDFAADYSHENPFPIKGQHEKMTVNSAFLNVFEQAAGFFCK